MSQRQSQGQAEDVSEQLHVEQSFGPVETGEAWKDSRAVEKVPWLLLQKPFILWPSLRGPRHIEYRRRRSRQYAAMLGLSKTPTMFDDPRELWPAHPTAQTTYQGSES